MRYQPRSIISFGPRSHLFLWLFAFFLLLQVSFGDDDSEEKQWTHDFAVELKADSVEAQLVASSHGFEMIREISDLKVCHFKHPKACPEGSRCKYNSDIVERLEKEPHVKRVEQQFILERDKRKLSIKYRDRDFDIKPEEPEENDADREYEEKVFDRSASLDPGYNDPKFDRQWHLNNFGQFANPGLDMNILPAWHKGYKGNGSRVTIVDDGIDTKHPELVDNYDPLLSADLNDPLDISGNPRSSRTVVPKDEGHGTKCAGEIGAKADNNVCGVGVAPDVRIGGIRILAGKITDLLESYSILHQNQKTDIYSCSWGPKDNGKKMSMPRYYTGKALKYSATKGRGGLGNLFFYASGNGGRKGDNCGPDAYVNAPYTMPISAVNVYGRSVSYGERCSATFATVPVGGLPAADAGGRRRSFPRITTCVINKGCTKRFMGTSAAAPLGAGCMALVLEANRNLTWRDAQHVIARACRIPNPAQPVWQRNGAGFHVSHHFGFGLIDCSKAVKIAQSWKNVGTRNRCAHYVFKGRKQLFYKSSKTFHLRVKDCRSPKGKKMVNYIEHVTVAFRMKHVIRGDVQLWLISPKGTISRLLGKRWPDKSKKGIKQTFLSRFLLGENPRGQWTVIVQDTGWRRTKRRRRGTIYSISMRIYGTEERPPNVKNLDHAYKMPTREIKETFDFEREEALNTYPLHKDVNELIREIEKRKVTGEKADIANIFQQFHNLKKKGISKEDFKVLQDEMKGFKNVT